MDQAVLGKHQGQTAVGNQLRVHRLAQIPDLGQGHLETHRSGGQFQFLHHIHGPGIVNIQAEVPVNPHAGLPDRGQQAQVTHQGVLHPQLPELSQPGGELGQLPVVDNPGQSHRQPSPLDQAQGGGVILQQDVQRHIEHGGFQIQQGGSQLLPGGDLDGQSGQAPAAPLLGRGLGFADGLLVPPGPQGGELIQHIPAHGVDGGGGDDQPRLHMGAHLGAAEGGAAGFGHPLGHHGPGERQVPGQLRPGAVAAADPALRVGGRQVAAVHRHCGVEFQVHQRGFSRLVGLPGSLKPLAVLPGLLADAEHLLVHPAGVVAVGKALAVEGGHQGVHHGSGHRPLVQGLAVNRGDGGHIFRPLHPAFQLDGGHAHGLQLLQVVHQAVVLQAQGILFLPPAVAVALAAGLGTPAPVTGPSADHRGHIALPGIAHAQRSMGKYLNFNGRAGADVADLLPGQLPAQNHPAHAHGRAQLHPRQGVNRHLGGAVDGHLGGNLAAQLHHPQVLDDEGVHVVLGGVPDQLRHFPHLPVRHQGVHRQMNLNPPDMTIFDCLHQGLGGEILCALPGVKAAAAEINRVGSVLHRGPQRLHGAGGGQ